MKNKYLMTFAITALIITSGIVAGNVYAEKLTTKTTYAIAKNSIIPMSSDNAADRNTMNEMMKKHHPDGKGLAECNEMMSNTKSSI